MVMGVEKRSVVRGYTVTDANWNNDWTRLRGDCKYLTDWGTNLLKNGLKGSIKSILLEPHYVCKDHRNLFSNFYSKKFEESSPFTERLHFFSESIPDALEVVINPDKYRDSYVGYSVIRPVKDRCIGRTVIDPTKLASINQDNFYCLRTNFHAHIGGRHFTVKGYPYVSQDGDVTVCAHSALWSVCRYLSERYTIYAETYPFDLIRLMQPIRGRTFPYRGMTYEDYCIILSEFGCYPILMRLKESRHSACYDNKEYENLYSYIESGFPVLASYQGHVVTVIGHTIDYSKNVKPDADGFLSSLAFLKQFVVVDDNFFPYQLLGEKDDLDNYGARYPDPQYDIYSIVVAVCPLPEKVFLPADKAREVCLKYFKELKPELETIGRGSYVTRLFVTTNTAFKRRKLETNVFTDKSGKIDVLSYYVSEFNLPHFVWVMELSPIDLYKKGICTAEIVLDATSNIHESVVIYMRIGNTLVVDGLQRKYDGNPKQFRQYTHNLGEK